MENNKLAIIIPSCDKYSDLWIDLVANIYSMWSDCSFDIYLLSNHFESPDPRIKTLKIGDDITWSANLITAISPLDYEYFLLFIDDLFITKKIDNNRVLKVLSLCTDNSWDYLRLNPYPGPSHKSICNNIVGRISPGDWYRSSTVFSLWKKEVLLNVLNPNESAWQLEIYGAYRTDKFLDWFSTYEPLIHYENLVIKGKVDPGALAKLRKLGITISTLRPIMTYKEKLIHKLKKLRSYAMQLVPIKKRRIIRAMFLSN